MRDWKADRVHSSVSFSVTYQGVGTFRGGFTDLEATLTGGETPQLTGLARVASVVAQDENLVGHLKSPDFFDAAAFPDMSFKSTSVAPQRAGHLKVTGDLTIRGTSRPVTLDVEVLGTGKDPWGNQRTGFLAKGRIDRTDFGLKWNQALETGGLLVSHDIDLELDIEAVEAKA